MKKLLTSVLVLCVCLALGFAFLSDDNTSRAAAAGGGFADVPADAWYAGAVAYVQEHGLMNGNTATEFAPEESLTRAMLATVVYRLAGEPTVSGNPEFTDVPAGQWYSQAVIWATQRGVVNGYGGGLFGPNDNVTQEQMALIMSRYAGQSVTDNIPGFSGGTAEANRAQVAATLQNAAHIDANNTDNKQVETMYIQVRGAKQAVWTAALADNSSATALGELLQQGDLSLALHDYGSFEKVGAIGNELPTNDEQITTEAGDLILYQGNQLVMFYGSNSWSYTRLGKIQGVTQAEMRDILGDGNVSITLTLNNPAPASTNTASDNITTNSGEQIALTALEHQNAAADAKVYYTKDITPEAMLAAYQALDKELNGNKIAVKLSTGEPPASNYLSPDLIKDLVQLVDGTIVECNTAYGGSRASNALHYQVAKDHGFTAIADFQILDENGSISLPVQVAVGVSTQLKENFVGAHFPEYDGYLVLSHFKGHAMAGFGGAIKNISIGLGSSEGKCWIHSGGTSRTSPWGGEQNAFTASMAEAGKSVVDALDGNILYISVMNRLSIDCDCNGNPAEPDMHDIGILASTDPVALDQACVDLVYASKDNNTALINRMESLSAFNTLAHGEEIGLGSRSYQLISLD